MSAPEHADTIPFVDDPLADQPLALPERPRRQFWGKGSAVLLALLLGAVGFYVGVRVEKGQLTSASSTSPISAAGSGARASAAAPGASTASAAAGGGRFGGAAGAGGGGGFLSRFGGGGSFGTVSSVNGSTIYVTELTSGNVIKVELSNATQITKSVGVGKSAIHPGDTVIVQGVSGSGGAISATSVNDAGARARAAGGGSGAGSSSNSPGSALNSLFGGGGG